MLRRSDVKSSSFIVSEVDDEELWHLVIHSFIAGDMVRC